MKKAALIVNRSQCMRAQVVQGMWERMRGLSGLAEGEWDGTPLVFPFARPCRPAFWMHGMTFPLDILWVAGGEIVGVSSEVPPSPSRSFWRNLFLLERLHPSQKIDMAIEMRAGEARRLGIQPGQPIGLEL